ncbi:hypothetical protein T484DRAFT_1847686 [Baffinella frigidus]|nr:hypothetical protein T484DRAFT_1847686 [Cryptophyta sp. CCMP2293]
MKEALRRICAMKRQDWSATGEDAVIDAGAVSMAGAVRFLVEHTRTDELWLCALRVLPPADSLRFTPAKEGYLRKKGGRLGMWHRRFYTIRYSSIFYYVKEKDVAVALSDPRGVIDLHIVSSVRALAVNDPPLHKANCLGLAARERSFFFQCDTKVEAAEWVRCIQECLDQAAEIRRAIAVGSLTAATESREPSRRGGRRGSGGRESGAWVEEVDDQGEEWEDEDENDAEGDEWSGEESEEEEEEEGGDGASSDDCEEWEEGDLVAPATAALLVSGRSGRRAISSRPKEGDLVAPATAALLARAEPSVANLAAVRVGLLRGGPSWVADFSDSGERELAEKGAPGAGTEREHAEKDAPGAGRREGREGRGGGKLFDAVALCMLLPSENAREGAIDALTRLAGKEGGEGAVTGALQVS